MAKRTCSIDGCERVHSGRGWCATHYRRWLIHGDPVAPSLPTSVAKTEAERFWPKVDASGVCWEWMAGLDKSGYGIFTLARRVPTRAHRWSYEHLVGPIPDGLVIDHLCRNPPCVNPDHLEPVTGRENTMRGYGPQALNARKTHCDKGHPFDGDNLRVTVVGGRRCQICDKEYRHSYYVKKKEAAANRIDK